MQQKINIKETISQMQVGDTQEFPIAYISNVRSHASLIGLTLKRTFSTTSDKERMTVKVTRVN